VWRAVFGLESKMALVVMCGMIGPRLLPVVIDYFEEGVHLHSIHA